MNKIIALLIFFLIVGCSKDKTPVPNINTEIEEVKSPILDLVNVETVSETPFSYSQNTIVHNGALYVIDRDHTYKFDFSINEWQTISDIDGRFIGNREGMSFIRNEKWCLFNFNGLWEFDFETTTWTKTAVNSEDTLFIPKGFYVNDSLYFISNANGNDNIYTYDFMTNDVSKYGNFENFGNFGPVFDSTFQYDDEYYTILYTQQGLIVYKYSDNFKNLEIVNTYKIFPLENGSAFLWNDKIIFGIGGSATIDTDGNYKDQRFWNAFHYYDIDDNEFGLMPTEFHEERYGCLPVTLEGTTYLLNGTMVIDDSVVQRKTMEKLKFDFVDE